MTVSDVVRGPTVTDEGEGVGRAVADGQGLRFRDLGAVEVDADGVGKPLGQKYGVTGFPSAYLCLAIFLGLYTS